MLWKMLLRAEGTYQKLANNLSLYKCPIACLIKRCDIVMCMFCDVAQACPNGTKDVAVVIFEWFCVLASVAHTSICYHTWKQKSGCISMQFLLWEVFSCSQKPHIAAICTQTQLLKCTFVFSCHCKSISCTILDMALLKVEHLVMRATETSCRLS